MKKHSFLFYFFLWPFLLLFAMYKYLFIALSHIISYIEYGIDYFISRHPIDFRSIFNHIKELIIYCHDKPYNVHIHFGIKHNFYGFSLQFLQIYISIYYGISAFYFYANCISDTCKLHISWS